MLALYKLDYYYLLLLTDYLKKENVDFIKPDM